MAGERADGGGASEAPVEEQAAAHEPRECMPCRGSGRVISNLGSSPELVSCPWCGGSGQRTRGVDAQARWLEGRAQAGAEGVQDGAAEAEREQVARDEHEPA